MRGISPRLLLSISALTVTAGCFDFEADLATCVNIGTCAPPTSTPPAVDAEELFPQDGATNVPLDVRISVSFTKPMDPATVAVQLTGPAGAVALGSATFSEGDLRVSFPPANLQGGASHTISVEGSDKLGNPLSGDASFSFTTAPVPDTTRPVVIQTAPGDNALNVAPNGDLLFNFSEPMDPASVAGGAVSVSPLVLCIFTWSHQNSLLRCEPEGGLALSTAYTVTLGTGLKDVAGNSLASPFQIHFTTAASTDSTRPTLVSSTPGNAGTGAARRPTVTLRFSEAMDLGSVESAFSITSPASPAVTSYSYEWSADSTEVSITPNATYEHGTIVNWSLAASAMDLAGNTLATAVQRSLQVRRKLTVEVTSEAVADGYITRWTDGTTFTVTDDSYCLIGDNGSSPPKFINRCFLSFPFVGEGLVPADALGIVRAELRVYLRQTAGAPDRIGLPVVNHVAYGTSLGADDYDLPTLPCSGDCAGVRAYDMPNDFSVGFKAATVTGAVAADFADQLARGNRTQFRLRMSGAETYTGNSISNYVVYGTNEVGGPSEVARLTIDYEVP